MTPIVNYESSPSPKTDSAEGGWVVLDDAEINQVVSRDHDPALARQKAVESGVLRPIPPWCKIGRNHNAGSNNGKEAMIYPYQQLPVDDDAHFLPLIPVTVIGPALDFECYALVDSGSDQNVD